MSDSVSNYNVNASIQKEQSDGTFSSVEQITDLYKIFHPLEGNTKASPTGYKINGKDLSDIFHPLAVSGKEVSKDTGLTVTNNINETKDLKKIFARINSLSVELKLNQLPAGAFTCDTHFRVYLDTSGSMDTALNYVRPAVGKLKNFVNAVYGNNNVSSVDGDPFEQCITWIASALDFSDPPKEVQIAYINEADDGGMGAAEQYYTRWKAVTDAGGVKYGAIGGVEIPGHGFAGEVKSWLQSQQDKHGDIGLSGFFDINDSTTSAEYMQDLVTWLNIPTEPSMLNTTVAAINPGNSTTRVNWYCSDHICGLTHVPDNSKTAGYRKTQKHWKYEIANDDAGSNILKTVQQDTRPTDITYTPTNGTGNTFWCRVTAVGNGAGVADKQTAWVECAKANRAPTLFGAKNHEINIGQTWTDPGVTVVELDDIPSTTRRSGGPDSSTTVYASGDVDTSTVGEYQITYSYTDDDGSTASEVRTVTVVNTAPELKLLGDAAINVES